MLISVYVKPRPPDSTNLARRSSSVAVTSTVDFSGQPTAAMASELRSRGYVPIPEALTPPTVARLTAALDRVYEEEVCRGRTRARPSRGVPADLGRAG